MNVANLVAPRKFSSKPFRPWHCLYQRDKFGKEASSNPHSTTVATVVTAEKSAIVRCSPAIHFVFAKKVSMIFKLSMRLSRALVETVFSPAKMIGRWKNCVITCFQLILSTHDEKSISNKHCEVIVESLIDDGACFCLSRVQSAARLPRVDDISKDRTRLSQNEVTFHPRWYFMGRVQLQKLFLQLLSVEQIDRLHFHVNAEFSA